MKVSVQVECDLTEWRYLMAEEWLTKLVDQIESIDSEKARKLKAEQQRKALVLKDGVAFFQQHMHL